MPWDVIVTDFGGEETINFGPRKESGSALYQIETLATISSRDEDQYIPCTKVSVLGDLACIGVQEHLYIFKDCQQTASVGFDGLVDCIEWSPDGTMLMAGDSTGKLSLLDTDTADVLFSFKVVPEGCIGKAFKRILFNTKSDGTSDLIILAATGLMLVIRDLSLDLFSADEGKIATSLKKIIRTNADDFHTEGVNDVVCFDDKIVTMGCGDIALGLWIIEDGQLVLEDEIPSCVFNGSGLIEGKISSDGKHLFVLSDKHSMILLKTTTLTALNIWSDLNVEEFQFLETRNIQDQSLQDMKIVLLTVGEGNKTSLIVQSLPTCEIVYNLQLHQPSTLANCRTFQETLFLAECSPSSENEQYYSVRLRCLTETNPETRLYRILHRKQFEEAETFAKIYRLDTELVHKVKAHYLLDQLSPWNKNSDECVKEMSKQFTHCLGFIKDDLHVAEICTRAALSSLEATQKLLNYSKERLLKVSTDKNAETAQKEKQQVLLSKLYEIQHRLVTFKLIHGAENYSAEKWDIFMKADLMKLVMSMLKERKLNQGLIILSRHECELEKWLTTPTVIHHFLQLIPDHIKAGEIQCVLAETIIPTVARILPQALVNVVTWIMKKAKSLELSDKKAWPVNALQFLRSMYGVLVKEVDIKYSNSIYTAADISMKTQIERVEVLESMRTLITNLQHFHDLQTKYNCKLTFGNFLQETTETVVFRMLDEVVAMQMISQTIENQIRPYMREHNLREDIIFSKYITDLLDRSGRTMSYFASWEPKVTVMINCISNQQYKCSAILEAMKIAPIPWSTEIDNLVQQGLKLEHELVNDIREQIHLMELKKLMFKYNRKKEDIPSNDNWEMLMYYILSQNSTDSIEDAFNVMRGYSGTLTHDLYVFRMRHLIKNGMVYECIDLLKSLPENERLACGQRIIQYIVVLLNDLINIDEEIHKKKTMYTEAGCYIITLIVDYVEDFMESTELKNLQSILQNLLALQKEYDQFITIDQYNDERVRTNLMVNYAKQFFMKKATNKKESTSTKLYRLANILQISYVTMQGQFIIEAAKTGNIQTALKHCSQLLESDRTDELAETLYNVALTFLRLQADTETCDMTVGQLRSLPEVTCKLASEALAICSGHSDLFMKCLELNKAAALALSVSQQCEAGEYSLCEIDEMQQEKVTPSSEMVSDWMSGSMFKEDALVMNSAVILPLMSQYCICHPKIESADEAESIDKMKTCVIPVLQYLQDNSHIQLAYQILHHMLYSVYQTTLQHQIGIELNNETICENMPVQKSTLELIERIATPLVKEFLTGVLMKIFSSTFTDHQMALAYVLSRSKTDGLQAVMKIIQTSGHNYRRLRAISYVGIGAGEIYKDANIINMCQKLEVNAIWGNRLAKIKISFKDAFQMPFKEKIKLLPEITQSEGADTALIIDFCTAFGVNTDEGLLQYLDHVYTSSNHSTSLSESDTKRILLKKAKSAIDGINGKDILMQRLKSLFNKTDSYDYEKLEFLIDEMQRIENTSDGETYAKVLFYLKQYKRRYPPSDFEINYSPCKEKEEMKIMADSLSPHSSTRIPVHPLLDGANAWKIIGPELRKDTVASWIPVSQLLKMSADQVYIITIKNMVKFYVSTNKEPVTVKSQWNWQKKDANKDLLSNVKSLLEKVSNYEMAMACATWVVTQLPSGAEKVMALEGCILMAKKWCQALPENKVSEKEKAMAAVVKFSGMWRRLATEQILFLHGIQKPELHKQAGNPNKLIYVLYEHPCIVETTEDADVPDIHAIVEEVASLHEIDLQQTMLTLIQKWLPSASSKQQDADATMTFNFDSIKLGNETMSTSDDEDDQNLKRVMYLLRKGDKKTNLVYLLSFATKDDQTKEMVAITNMCRLRALHCILELDEEKLLVDLYGKSFDHIRELMKTFTYLVELEKLHILHSVESFQESNKDGLVKGIWRNHYHQQSAALLVASMCLDFKIHDKQLWNGVIQQILSFGLLENLEYILLRLNSVPDVWQIPVFPKAWQNILVTPLTKVVSPLSTEQLETCVHSFNLLKRCPIIHGLDVAVITQHFLQLEMHVCALSCLLFSGEEEAIQNVIARENTRLLENAERYLVYSIDSLSAQQVKDHVYAYIINNEEFSMIAETRFQTELIVYAVKNKNIAGLIKFAMEKNRKSDADKVLQLFISENRDYLNRLLKVSTKDDRSEFFLLKAYLELEGMGELVDMLD